MGIKFHPPSLITLMPPVTTKMLDRFVITSSPNLSKRKTHFFNKDNLVSKRLSSQRNLKLSIIKRKSNENSPINSPVYNAKTAPDRDRKESYSDLN